MLRCVCSCQTHTLCLTCTQSFTHSTTHSSTLTRQQECVQPAVAAIVKAAVTVLRHTSTITEKKHDNLVCVCPCLLCALCAVLHSFVISILVCVLGVTCFSAALTNTCTDAHRHMHAHTYRRSCVCVLWGRCCLSIPQRTLCF